MEELLVTMTSALCGGAGLGVGVLVFVAGAAGSSQTCFCTHAPPAALHSFLLEGAAGPPAAGRPPRFCCSFSDSTLTQAVASVSALAVIAVTTKPGTHDGICVSTEYMRRVCPGLVGCGTVAQ